MASASLPASARVAHLLAVAAREFAAHGYAHVSVDGVARAAGVSKETIYRHFADKGALFEAAIEASRDAFSAEVGQAADPAGDAAIAGYARAIYGSANADGYLSATWLTITSVAGFPELAARLHADGLARLEPVRAALAARAAADGRPATVTIDHAADLGAMAIEGPRHLMGWPWLEGPLAEQHVAATARLFVHGCAAGPSAPPAPSVPSPAPPPPAPPRAEHIAVLMATARAHFAAHGYRGANLDAIGAEARVGRGTLYRHFDGKAGLFEAVLLDEARALAAEAAARLPRLTVEAQPAETLAAVARVAGEVLTAERAVTLHRLAIAEARRAPRLARAVYATARLELMLPLTDYLAAGAAAGHFRLSDADWHARQFLTLATEGNRPLSQPGPPDAAHRAATARRAVATFLTGFASELA